MLQLIYKRTQRSDTLEMTSIEINEKWRQNCFFLIFNIFNF